MKSKQRLAGDKILGSIAGAAIGDAMGAVTETRSAEQIYKDFNGYVEDFLAPPDDCFARGLPAGSITDDFSLAYFTALELVKSKGKVDKKVAEQAILSWAEHPQYIRFAGPTTFAAINALKGIETEEPKNSFLACDNSKATNGASMKIFPAGLINPGEIDKAIQDAVVLCMPTHPNNIAISGACAIAAAVARAAEKYATLEDVLIAGIYGAQKGFQIGGAKGHYLAGASVEKRIRLAIQIGKQGLPWEKAMLELRDIVGAGLPTNEAVPCVFGILAATPGDVMGAVRMGVNIGDDTDTVATMAGAVAGALYGINDDMEQHIEMLEKVNDIGLRSLAAQIEGEFYH